MDLGYRVHTAHISYYVKPIALKFKINPEIPILHVVNVMPINFQSKMLQSRKKGYTPSDFLIRVLVCTAQTT